MTEPMHMPSTNGGFAALGGTLCEVMGDVGEPVTCAECLRISGRADPLPEEQPAIGVEAPAHFGARELSSTGRRALATAVEEQGRPKRRWKYADDAVRDFVKMRDEGSSLRSTCDPDRANRVQVSTNPSLGGREHHAVEQVATVARALDQALGFVADIETACPHVSPEQARGIYLMSIVGRAVRSHTGLSKSPQKGWFWRRITMSEAEVADYCAEHLEQPIERHHVLALRRHFRAVVQDALIASGEMAAPRAAAPRARRGSFGANPTGRIT